MLGRLWLQAGLTYLTVIINTIDVVTISIVILTIIITAIVIIGSSIIDPILIIIVTKIHLTSVAVLSQVGSPAPLLDVVQLNSVRTVASDGPCAAPGTPWGLPKGYGR